MAGLVGVCAVAGCESAAPNARAIQSYYRYDFTGAREALRGAAYVEQEEQVVHDNLRLGMAALADGDLDEAGRALGTTFELLSTAGLNEDRTTAAVLVHEGVRIWKGEPYEQALAFHYVAVLHALLEEYDNVHAAASNSLFRLRDFGADRAAGFRPAGAVAPERDYEAVDTDFALGFLMQALGASASGLSDGARQLDAAVTIDPGLEPLADELRSGAADTILLVDYGHGPRKVAWGPDLSLLRLEPVDRSPGEIVVRADGVEVARVPAACDVNQMAIDHRWNSFEEVRRAKSAVGHGLMFGGAVVAHHGSHNRSGGAVAAGLGMMAAGLLARAGARADTRHLEFAPQSIFLVPLRLERTADLSVSFAGDPGVAMRLWRVEPGRPGKPRAVYLRLFSSAAPARPTWLIADAPEYGNDWTGVRDGDYPWILGGRDVSTPTRAALEAYQAGGHLGHVTLGELRELYRAEGILVGSGRERRPDRLRNPSYRHILDGGIGLFTPHPHSMGYQRLMSTPRPPYQPRSDAIRELAARLRGHEGDGRLVAR